MLVQPNLRWLITAGTPGMAPDGTTPEGITAQAEQAWRNIVAMLEQAGMTVHDLVKVTHYLVRSEDIKPYVEVRKRFLGDARPASMLLVVPALVRRGVPGRDRGVRGEAVSCACVTRQCAPASPPASLTASLAVLRRAIPRRQCTASRRRSARYPQAWRGAARFAARRTTSW